MARALDVWTRQPKEPPPLHLYGPETSTNAKNTGLLVTDPCPSPLIVIRLLRDTPERHAVHPIRQLAPTLRHTIHRMPRAPVAAPVTLVTVQVLRPIRPDKLPHQVSPPLRRSRLDFTQRHRVPLVRVVRVRVPEPLPDVVHDFVARLTSLVSGPGFLPEILDPPFPTIPTLTPSLPSIPPKPTLTRTVLLSRRPPNELCPALLTQLRLRLHRSPPNAQTNSSTRPTSPVAAQPARRSSSSRVTGHHPPSAWTPQSPPPDPGDAYAPPRGAQRYAGSDPWQTPTRTCTRSARPDRTGPPQFRGSFSYLSLVLCVN